MKRTTLNFIIDSAAFLAFLVLVISGLVIRYSLPPGTGGREGGGATVLWGLDRHEWGDWHFWFALIMLGLLALHVVQHWRWIVAMVRGRQPERADFRMKVGLVALGVLAVAVLLPLLWPTQQLPGAQGRGRTVELAAPGDHASRAGDTDIRGNMNLRELESQTGVPAAYILRELGIHEPVPPHRRLGALRRQYGFSNHDVRRIIEQYNK
jgi:hypothetical protein